MKDDLPAQRKRVGPWLGGAFLLFLVAPVLFFMGLAASVATAGSARQVSISPITWILCVLGFGALIGCVYCLVQVVKRMR